MKTKYLLRPAILKPQVYFMHDEGWEWLEQLNDFHINYIGGNQGIGKKSLAYEYAYRNRDKYKNIYMVHFKDNWFDTWTHYLNVVPKNEEEYLEMFSAIIHQLEDSLLIIYDYISNDTNMMMSSVFNQLNVHTIFVTSKESAYDLEGLDYKIAYKLFEYYYMGDASSEREGVYRLIKRVNGNPSMMSLFAVVAGFYYQQGYRMPIERLNYKLDEVHPKYQKIKDKNSFDPMIYNLLKEFELTEEEKECIIMFYFTHDLKIKRNILNEAGISEETIDKLKKYQFVLEVDNMIILNKLLQKELYEKVLGKHKMLSKPFVSNLKTCSNTNLTYSFLLKVDPQDPLLPQALECIDETKAKEVDTLLLKECIEILKNGEFKHHINISELNKAYLEKKLDIDSLTKYINQTKINNTFQKFIDELINKSED